MKNASQNSILFLQLSFKTFLQHEATSVFQMASQVVLALCNSAVGLTQAGYMFQGDLMDYPPCSKIAVQPIQYIQQSPIALNK